LPKIEAVAADEIATSQQKRGRLDSRPLYLFAFYSRSIGPPSPMQNLLARAANG